LGKREGLNEVADVDHTDVIRVRGNAVLVEKSEPPPEVPIILIDGVVAQSPLQGNMAHEVVYQGAKFHASYLIKRITVL
jgi:hypothetical protein